MSEISVIVPVYKVEPYLRRCVDSILRQTYRDFELILVDDGSPDRCGEICEEYAAKDSRVIVIHQKNGGLSAARNAGIDWAFEHSKSKYLTFIDSDDWVAENYLEELSVGTKLTGGVACVGFEEVVGDSQVNMGDAVEWKAMTPHDYWLNIELPMTAWGKLYPKECFKSIRYPEGRIHEDEYVTYRVLFEYENIAANESKLYCYFRHVDSITKSKWSVKRLDCLDAWIGQINYFLLRGHHDLVHRCREYLAYTCVEALGYLPFFSSIKNRRRCGKILREQIKALGWTVHSHRNVWEVAHPIYMITVWPIVRFCEFIHRRGVFGSIFYIFSKLKQRCV